MLNSISAARLACIRWRQIITMLTVNTAARSTAVVNIYTNCLQISKQLRVASNPLSGRAVRDLGIRVCPSAFKISLLSTHLRKERGRTDEGYAVAEKSENRVVTEKLGGRAPWCIANEFIVIKKFNNKLRIPKNCGKVGPMKLGRTEPGFRSSFTPRSPARCSTHPPSRSSLRKYFTVEYAGTYC